MNFTPVLFKLKLWLGICKRTDLYIPSRRFFKYIANLNVCNNVTLNFNADMFLSIFHQKIITNERNHFLLYIREDSNSSLMGWEKHKKPEYSKTEF